jgi:hypothetical protein
MKSISAMSVRIQPCGSAFGFVVNEHATDKEQEIEPGVKQAPLQWLSIAALHMVEFSRWDNHPRVRAGGTYGR